MNNQVEKYLQELELNLSKIPKQDREDILLEIKNHIYETTTEGEDVAQTIKRMGEPSILAQAYSLSYRTEWRKLKPSDILGNFSFYLTTGITGALIISLLGFLMGVFLVVAVAISGMSLTNLIGITDIPMFVWEDASVPAGIWQLLLGSAVGVFFIWLTWLCWTEIKKYVRKISSDYRKLRLSH